MKKSSNPCQVMLCRGSFKVLLLVVIIFGIVVPLFIQIALQFQQSSMKEDALLASHGVLYVDMENKKLQVDTLESHLQELEDIRIKALNNLVRLDEKRVKLQAEIETSTKERDVLLKESKSYTKLIQRIKKEAEIAREVSRQKIVTNIVHVGVPKSQVSIGQKSIFLHETTRNTSCHFTSCFDYSRCSVLKKFSFYLHEPQSESSRDLFNMLSSFSEFTSSADAACISLILLKIDSNIESVNEYLHSLPSWKETGSNHVLLLDSPEDNEHFCNLIKHLKHGNSILATTTHCDQFQNDFDILIPNIFVSSLLPLFPITRKYFLYFYGQEKASKNGRYIQKRDLIEFQTDKDAYIKTICANEFTRPCLSGWCACGTIQERDTFLQESMFSIVVKDIKNNFLTEILDCFRNGVIPVILGSMDTLMFSSVIDWKLATVIIPYQRLPELLYILRTMPISDIINLKQQGQFLYQTYFSSQSNLVETIIGLVKNKIGIPPTPIHDYVAISISNITNLPRETELSTVSVPAHQFQRNFTYIGKNQHIAWNTYPGALKMYPVVPWDNPAPSQVQFLDEGKDAYMPIGDGKGGDGVAFSRALGGDYPVEQFTVLMLTYDREVILMDALQRLSGMKYLSKVIVVWNHPDNPTDDLSWPDIGVKIEVIRTGKNSLNNRFIPYASIETEAVLSMDDDIYLRHDEIELAFRVWRENRDRLVGFPGRHHAYNESSKSFYYNSEHSCELSLVLTGGAFFHKYYSYIYTYNMDSSIRQMVDDFMNCEDIAMNFLVAHVTKKPPIKVTSRWTFRCPGCPVALSADANHYEERNRCMAFFEKVYGYNPLKRTQFRADSILFKTRLPSTMTKCFQFV